MRDPFPVIDVQTEGHRSLDEPMGTKRKFWVAGGAGQRYLFKYPRPGTGEYWSEKIAAEIGAALGVACAQVDLARFQNDLGCSIRSFAPPASRLTLVHGNELLQQLDNTYPVTQVRGVSRHTVSAVLGALRDTGVPPGADATAPLLGGPQWFLGYLLLDALILNGDRHHENWGVLESQDGGARVLAPSYDHASSLGRELPDQQRLRRLGASDRGYTVETYADRARSSFFANDTDPKPLHPFAAFRAAAEIEPAAARAWLDRLGASDDHALADIVGAVPASIMTEPSRDFALELMRKTRARLLSSV